MFRQSTAFPPPIHGSDAPSQQQHQPFLQPPPVSETSPRQQITVSSSPVKSHPLHNFPLSDLRWAMNHANTHRLRKAASKSPLREANPGRGNLAKEEVNEAYGSASFELRPEKKKGSVVGVSDFAADRSGTKSTTPDGRSKIFIRIRTKNNDEAADIATISASATDIPTSVAVAQVNDDSAEPGTDADVTLCDRTSDGGGQEADEFGPKTWNLRPRKPPPTKKRSIGHSGGVMKSCSNSLPENKTQGTVRTETIRSRNGADAKIAATTERKEKKPRLSISLSKMEIDEDIYALTGSKPSRRPKRRAKNVQKQLDVCGWAMFLPKLIRSQNMLEKDLLIEDDVKLILVNRLQPCRSVEEAFYHILRHGNDSASLLSMLQVVNTVSRFQALNTTSNFSFRLGPNRRQCEL